MQGGTLHGPALHTASCNACCSSCGGPDRHGAGGYRTLHRDGCGGALERTGDCSLGGGGGRLGCACGAGGDISCWTGGVVLQSCLLLVIHPSFALLQQFVFVIVSLPSCLFINQQACSLGQLLA